MMDVFSYIGIVIVTASAMLTIGAVVYFRVLTPIANKGRIYTILVLPLAIPMYALDIAYNATIGSLLFWQLPVQWTFSNRLQLLTADTTWRGALAHPISVFVNWLTEPNHIRGV